MPSWVPGSRAPNDPVMSGLIIKGKYGYAAHNPLVSIARRAAGDMVRFAAIGPRKIRRAPDLISGIPVQAYRVTTTVVPTLTRPNRSLMSWLYMRMQP